MTELKPLKDIIPHRVTDRERIKKEAIKWVKERSENCQQCNYYGWLCEEHEFWKKRFNITEVDLE